MLKDGVVHEDRFALPFCGVHGKAMSACRVCGNTLNNRCHMFQEKFLGLGDEFVYAECSVCKSLSIVKIPRTMKRYYPETYYSYVVNHYSRFLGYVKGKRDRYFLYGSGMIGRLLSLRLPAPAYIEWLRNLALPFGSRILDVGSGGGALAVNLQDAGFPTTGIDPYISSPIEYPNGAVVLKQSLEQTRGSYDCIMLHHCLEHMAVPREAFGHLSRLLNPGGKVLVRTPVAGTYAWKTFGNNWFQLDAPRHFVIFSEDALRRLAGETGFNIESIIYDSTASQFWASEQYLRGIALASDRSYSLHPEKSIFSADQIADYVKQTSLLNAQSDGDQASFYLSKASMNE